MNLQTMNQHLLSIEDFYTKKAELFKALKMELISVDEYIVKERGLIAMLLESKKDLRNEQEYLLLDENSPRGLGFLDTCMAESESHADTIFKSRGWSLDEASSISEFDLNEMLKADCELNSLESQSAEC